MVTIRAPTRFTDMLLDISTENVLINISGFQSSSVKQLLESHPGNASYGPWVGSQPRVWRARTASDYRIDIPDTSIRLKDSEAVRSFEFISEDDYPQVTIKLVGFGQGTSFARALFMF
jgi:hypothetical protein